MLHAQSFRSSIWFAYRSGSFVGVRVRGSAHSPSGAVAVFVFASRSRAARFASAMPGRVGAPVVLRHVAGRYAVSVPLAPFVAQPLAPRFFSPRGGMRAVAAVAPVAAALAA